MKTTSGYVVNISESRLDDFEGSLMEYGSFAEPVPDFSHERGRPLVCFVSTKPGSISHLAMGKSGVRAGTNRTRLNLGDFLELPRSIRKDAIASLVGSGVAGHVRKRLKEGGPLAPRSFDEVVAAVMKLSSDAREYLGRFSEERKARITRLSEGHRNGLAAQKEAVNTALTIAGIDRDVLLSWTPESPNASLLDGIPSARVLEDQMIWHDRIVGLPGLEEVRKSVTGAARFESESVRLEVVVANRTALEKQTGADLIYFNATFKAFVLVQYKAMEKDASRNAVFRIPNTQLTLELDRMRKSLAYLNKAASASHRDHFRLNENPFFLKLCSRIVLDPNSVALTSGLYIPLGMWPYLETDTDLLGPRGGRALSFENVGRHITNTEFADLVRGAWIGTTPHQSAILGPFIEEALKTGKAIVMAVGVRKNQR